MGDFIVNKRLGGISDYVTFKSPFVHENILAHESGGKGQVYYLGVTGTEKRHMCETEGTQAGLV